MIAQKTNKNALKFVVPKDTGTTLFMDNQDSNPQIIFPNVPDDFCPSGDWRNIFQTFIDTVLANGTVNIPDLSDLSPEAIAQLTTDVANLQTEVNAIQANIVTIEGNITTLLARPVVTIKTNQTAVGASDQQYSVSFASPMPSATYSISLTPISNSATNPTARVYLVNGTKTAAGFQFMVEAASADTTFVEWTAIHTT